MADVTKEELEIALKNNPGSTIEMIDGKPTVVVSAIGAMVGSGDLSLGDSMAKARSDAAQKAMQAAIMFVFSKGIPNTLETAHIFRELQVRAKNRVLSGKDVNAAYLQAELISILPAAK